MNAPTAIPATPDDLTKQWLTGALHAGGRLAPGATVARFDFERVGEGVGFVGHIVRLRMRYDGDAAGAPPTLIAKFPSPDPGAREIANLYGMYEREVRFYTDVGSAVGMRAAECYYCAMEPERDLYVLLLEDLSASGDIGDQLAGCTREQASLALCEAAKMHARWWNSPRFSDIPWLPEGADLVANSMTNNYLRALPVFIDAFGPRVDASIAAALPRLGDDVMRIIDSIAGETLTLGHGDFRMDNIFFGHAGAPYRIAVVDWQTPCRTWGAYECAYFLGTCMPVAQRRQHQDGVLAEYHAALVAGGVHGYSVEQLHLDYRRCLLIALALMIVSGSTLEQTNQRAVDLFDAIFERLSAAIIDNDALSLSA